MLDSHHHHPDFCPPEQLAHFTSSLLLALLANLHRNYPPDSNFRLLPPSSQLLILRHTVLVPPLPLHMPLIAAISPLYCAADIILKYLAE